MNFREIPWQRNQSFVWVNSFCTTLLPFCVWQMWNQILALDTAILDAIVLVQSDAMSKPVYHPQACQTEPSLLCLFFWQCLGGGSGFFAWKGLMLVKSVKNNKTSKYCMVVAPNLNYFPKANLAHLCCFSGWPCFIAGRAFLFLVFNTMHLSSFISYYFTFAYSESRGTDCHLQQKYFTEDLFQSSTELLCIILNLIHDCLPEV